MGKNSGTLVGFNFFILDIKRPNQEWEPANPGQL